MYVTSSNKSKANISGILSPQQDKNQSENRRDKSNKNESHKFMHQSECNLKSSPKGISSTNNDKKKQPKMDTDNITTFLTNQNHSGDLCNVLSSSMANDDTISKIKTQSREINVSVLYMVSKLNTEYKGLIVDRVANGGLAGEDVRIICKHNPPHYFYVSGLNSNQVKDLEIVTAGGVAPSQRGPVIIILRQYAYLGSGNTIHSCIQLESFKNIIDDKSINHKGSQTLK